MLPVAPLAISRCHLSLGLVINVTRGPGFSQALLHADQLLAAEARASVLKREELQWKRCLMSIERQVAHHHHHVRVACFRVVVMVWSHCEPMHACADC